MAPDTPPTAGRWLAKPYLGFWRVVTPDDEDLHYDTREEAQARADELNAQEARRDV